MAAFDPHTLLDPDSCPEILGNTAPQRCDLIAKGSVETRIEPELECFCLPYLVRDTVRPINGGVDKPPDWINCVLGGERGFQNASRYSPEILDRLVAHLPKRALFCVSGIGTGQFAAMTHAVPAGGHVRVGLEDTL